MWACLWVPSHVGRYRCEGREPRLRVFASEKAARLLTEARAKYEGGDKLQALKIYEDVMLEDPSPPQRQAALYGNTAVHASFGDVELAQMTLRAAIQEGLDFEQALQDPELPEIVTSQQIIIQLKKFNQQTIKAQQVAALRQQAYSSVRPNTSRASDVELLDIIGKPNAERLDIDASPLGVMKRVILVVLAGAVLGTVLFYVGLESLFPKY